MLYFCRSDIGLRELKSRCGQSWSLFWSFFLMWIQFLAIVGLRSVREVLNSLPQEGVVYRFYRELMPPFVSWGKRVGLSGANTENMKPKPQKAERRGREKCRSPSQHPWNHWLFSLPELVTLPCDEVFSHIQCKESLWRRTNLQCTSDSPEE